MPQSATPTNFLVWQGLTWNSPTDSSDNPVGYFGTNFSYTYITNTTVTASASNWQLVSPYIKGLGSASVSSGGWTNSAVDLSAFAGQTLQLAFHFQSGPIGWGNAPGWYVDDLRLPPRRY